MKEKQQNFLFEIECAFSHKVDNLKIYELLNLEGHPHCNNCSKVKASLLNGSIVPIGGVASGRVCV